MTILNEWQSKQALGVELPRPREILAATRDQALDFARSTDTTVVAKACGLAHKTEAGLVRIGLTEEDIGVVWDELAAKGDGTVLLAEQVHAELELIVGGYRDPEFGPLVTLGIGGIAAEIYSDMVAILAPPEAGEIAGAIQQLSGKRMFEGIRGGPPVDLSALEKVMGLVSDLLINDTHVVEIDCNPVMISQGKPLVVDALVVKADTKT